MDAKDAENYYKAMYYARASSWNLRDTHMFQTLVRILKHRGPDAKAIVWAHNSHLGDARATGMGRARGELNLGQLCREAWGDDVRNIGCSTYTGTVAAADEWDGDMRVKRVRPGMKGSYEELMHRAGEERFLLDLRAGRCDARLRAVLMEPKLERFIGVLYLPETERQSHYSGAVLPEQFDGWVWFDETKAVRAFETHQPQTPVEMDETWPFGL
jgi:erythromycin esterase-like protein